MSAPNDGTYAVSRILQHRMQSVTDENDPGYDYLVRWKDEENQVQSVYSQYALGEDTSTTGVFSTLPPTVGSSTGSVLSKKICSKYR